MDEQDLVNYLRTTDRLALTPMESVLAQTQAMGDTSMPSAEHVAILNWVGEAFKQWENEFPLEEPLVSQLRQLKPLAATLAIRDPNFLIPGAHPLHRILDKMQLAAIGWQLRLGRVGEGLRKQLFSTVEEALTWFETQNFDLAALCSRLISATERDQARASRMTQRTIETEQGRLKTTEAKRVAADMINTAMKTFGVPQGIGAFLRGPWYDSAQLVLLKFGAESEQWTQMSETTTTLLDSLRLPDEGEEPQRRQQLFETVTRLPRELKRWLLSVPNVDDTTDESINLIEHTHMEILRRHPIELEPTELIPIPSQSDASAQQAHDSIRTDQWFLIDNDDGNPLRARLVSPVDGPGELLFTNQAGIRVFQQSLDEFTRMIEAGSVSLLDSGASFSRSLARAAGIETVSELEKLLGDANALARHEEARLARLEKQQPLREQQSPERLTLEEDQAAPPDQATTLEPTGEGELADEATNELRLEELEAEQLQREWDEALRRKKEREGGTQ